MKTHKNKKMNIKKLGLAFAFSSAIALSAGVQNALAEAESAGSVVTSDFDLKLNGFAHFQSGYRNQSNLASDEKHVSANRDQFAFYNDAGFFVTGKKNFNDIEYGAKIVLVPTAKRKGSPSFNGSHIFVESPFGKVELGSPISASTNMFVDGFSIVAGTGDDWSRYANYENAHMKQIKETAGKTINGVTFDDKGNAHAPGFTTYAEYFLDDRLATSLSTISSEPSRAISYYTPKFELGEMSKVQLGVSYIPDSSNTGADSSSKASSGEKKIYISVDEKEGFEFNTSVKDAFTVGISLEHNFMDGVDIKIAATGEAGSASGKMKRISEDPNLKDKEFKLADLRSYNIGAILNYANFSFAGGYGSLGKSLTTPEFHKTGRETHYYSGAVAYKYGPFNTSISYFRTDSNKNTLDSIALGTDFKLAPGLKTYVEVATFNLQGKPEYLPDLKKKKTRGTAGIVGMKLSL